MTLKMRKKFYIQYTETTLRTIRLNVVIACRARDLTMVSYLLSFLVNVGVCVVRQCKRIAPFCQHFELTFERILVQRRFYFDFQQNKIKIGKKSFILFRISEHWFVGNKLANFYTWVIILTRKRHGGISKPNSYD